MRTRKRKSSKCNRWRQARMRSSLRWARNSRHRISYSCNRSSSSSYKRRFGGRVPRQHRQASTLMPIELQERRWRRPLILSFSATLRSARTSAIGSARQISASFAAAKSVAADSASVPITPSLMELRKLQATLDQTILDQMILAVWSAA